MARTSLTIVTTTLASALVLSGCVAGDADPADDNAGEVQIETSPETEDSQADVGDGNPDAANPDAAAGESIVVISGTTYPFMVLCTRAPGEVDLGMSGVTSSGTVLNAGFGTDDPSDSIAVAIDGTPWRTDSSGNYGEILSLEVDVDAGTARGDAEFETPSGETAEGSFDLACSDF